jgi:hypothetical protein
MYFPSSQVEINLVSNGDLAYKSTNALYYGIYFSTSDGKYYANSPNDTVLIELIKPKPTTNNNEFQLYFDEAETIEGPDARFESYENELYSLITKASKTPPNIDPPPYYHFSPLSNEVQKGYAIRFFAKKVNQNSYIEISNETYDQFINLDSKVAINLYEVANLVWYLRSPGDQSVDESNFINILNFEKKYNWKNFNQFLKVNKEKKDFLYTKGGELLLPNRTNYIGYYHTMPDGRIMTGKEHGDGPELILIPLKPIFTVPSDEEISPSIQSFPSSEGSSGGGGY